MKLIFNFDDLWSVVKSLEVDISPFYLGNYRQMDPIDSALSEKGIDVALDDLENNGGLLTYKGRQVLLYIPDHGWRVQDALESPRKSGKKFHVAHCETLETMRSKNRFERYTAAANLDGEFLITGTNRSNENISDYARLDVCKFCLKELNYKKSARSTSIRKSVCDTFDIAEFFETYSSCFKYLPVGNSSAKLTAGYSKDWPQISASTRELADWKCSTCRIDLRSHQNLLHVHHVNGVKQDNSPSNLKVLCAACHRDQPLHERMFIKSDDMRVISDKRKQAGLLEQTWDAVFRYSDPALRGLLDLSQNKGMPPPQLNHNIGSGIGSYSLDAAWERERIAVCLSDQNKPAISNWEVLSLREALIKMAS